MKIKIGIILVIISGFLFIFAGIFTQESLNSSSNKPDSNLLDSTNSSNSPDELTEEEIYNDFNASLEILSGDDQPLLTCELTNLSQELRYLKKIQFLFYDTSLEKIEVQEKELDHQFTPLEKMTFQLPIQTKVEIQQVTVHFVTT